MATLRDVEKLLPELSAGEKAQILKWVVQELGEPDMIAVGEFDIELGVDGVVNPYLSVFANYSYKWKPVVEDLPAGITINDHAVYDQLTFTQAVEKSSDIGMIRVGSSAR